MVYERFGLVVKETLFPITRVDKSIVFVEVPL